MGRLALRILSSTILVGTLGCAEPQIPPQLQGDSRPKSELTPAAPAHRSSGPLGAIPQYSAALSAPNIATLQTLRGSGQQHGANVTAANTRRGTPSFTFSRETTTSRTPKSAALDYLNRFSKLYGISAHTMDTAAVTQIHNTGQGAIVVNLSQNVADTPVYGVRMNVIMNQKLDLVAIAGQLHPTANVAPTPVPALSESDVLQLAVDDVSQTALTVIDARITPVLYPYGDVLIRARQIDFEVSEVHSNDARAYLYVIGDDGRILERINQTFSDSFEYRVWADTTAPFTPADGPHVAASPYIGEPFVYNTPIPPLVYDTPNLIAVEGLNTNPQGLPDPWLSANSTVTSGNNVIAYADHESPNGLGEGDLQPGLTAPNVFDHSYAPLLSPVASPEQSHATTVQMFYTINWLHDYYYDSGFNENTAIAQADNYGRGTSIPGDPMLAEAQDGKGEGDNFRNNANMNTRLDGASPRMQMYLFDGTISYEGTTEVLVQGKSYLAQPASFGVDTPVAATANLVVVPGDGCPTGPDDANPIADITGLIAVIDRGECAFVAKVLNAIDSGAVGVLIVNNSGESPPQSLTGADTTIAVPVFGISQSDGELLKTAIAAGPVSANLSRGQRQQGPDRDGTFDNSIVAHEWGHYFHLRLSDCRGTQQCGAMGEGWGDFIALQMMVRPGDDIVNGVYGMASYVTANPYSGIRRVPYSTRFDRNALTFKHIGKLATLPDTHPVGSGPPNNEVHAAGEVWATILTEVYFAMLQDERYSFSQAKRRFSDYMVAGLLAAPANATFIETRDSLLAVALASDLEDAKLMAQAFARRGMGTTAVGPHRNSVDFEGIEESYAVTPQVALAIGDMTILGVDCDEDKIWDAGETVTLELAIKNNGIFDFEEDTTIELSADNDAISFPNGNTLTFAANASQAIETASIAIKLASTVEAITEIALTIATVNQDVSGTRIIRRRVNYDETIEGSTNDDVESYSTVWNVEVDSESDTPEEKSIWHRDYSRTELNTLWHAIASKFPSDVRLESPVLQIGTAPLHIEFEHRYEFQQDSPGTENVRNWDAGVFEISTDGGATWNDLGLDYELALGYDGAIEESDNPLGRRAAYTGKNADHPEMTKVELDLGTTYAEQTLQFRFRLGSNGFDASQGWEIDNIKLQGITNLPFPQTTEDGTECAPDDDSSGGCGCQSGTGGGTTNVLFFFGLAILLWRRGKRHRVSSRVRDS